MKTPALTLGLLFVLTACQPTQAADSALASITNAVGRHDCAAVLKLVPPYLLDNYPGMGPTRSRNLQSAFDICQGPKTYWRLLDELEPGFPDNP